MEYIDVIFSRSRHPASYAIRAFTWSRWSHVAAIMPGEHEVIESLSKKGVVVSPLWDFKERYPEFYTARVPVRSRRAAYLFLRKQLGKPYDMTAILSMPLRRDWQETDSWFCSELVAGAMNLYRKDYVKRITPEDIWRISEDIE